MERRGSFGFAFAFAFGVGVLDAWGPTSELLATDGRDGLWAELAAFTSISVAITAVHFGVIASLVGLASRLGVRLGLPGWLRSRGVLALVLLAFSWAAFVGVEVYDTAYEPNAEEWAAIWGRGAVLLMVGLAAALHDRASERFRRVGGALALGFALAGPLFLGVRALPAEAQSPASPSRPNIVLYVIDTLRADALGAYGYPRETSPAFDLLASEGVLFDRAYVQYTASTASHATIQTGCYPARHGAVANGMSIPTSVTTLATRLREEGYATAAFHNHGLLSQDHGFDRGFDVFVETHQPVLRATPFHVWTHELHLVRAWHVLLQTQTVVPLARSWLATAREPFFLWVTTMQPHRPYLPPRSLLAEFQTEPYDGPFNGRTRDGLTASDVSDADLAHMRNRYDAEVRWADQDVAALVGQLAESKLSDRTLLVVTSDHGEAFGEHGVYFDHGDLHEESVHVPLVMRGPGMPNGVRVPEAVGMTNLAATLLARAKDQAGAEACDGRDLSDLWSEAPQPRAPVLAWKHGKVTAIDERSKLILARYPEGKAVFYDLASDPAETNPIDPADAAEAQRLRGQIDRYCEGSPREIAYCAAGHPIKKDGTDAETLRRLRELGYVE